MKKILSILVFTAFTTIIAGQNNFITERAERVLQKEGSALAWIYLTDKGNDLEEYFYNPSSVVTERSLARRAKVNYSESLIDYSDLPVNLEYIKTLSDLGIKIKNRSKWFNSVSAYISSTQLDEIVKLPFVKKVDLVAQLKSSHRIEEGFSAEAGNAVHKKTSTVELDYGESLSQLALINVPEVHAQGLSGAGVTICVMDAGFDLLAHEAFENMNITATWDFVNGDEDVENSGDMGNGSHGTKVLSTLGGFKEGKIIGPAYNAEFILAKTENTDSETPIEEDNWVAAMEWADSLGADITSTSLSYLDYDPPYPSYTWENMDGNTALITRAGDLAVKKGMVVVNSAGNNGYHPEHNTLGAPADGDSVIAAGSVTMNGDISYFSSVGNTVDGRIKPDFMAPGSGVYCASNLNTGVYTYASGTSFSCPILSGVIALILESNPSLTPMEVREILRQTSSNSASPDREFGWGIVDALAAVNASITNVETENLSPAEFKLLQNYPNPFNPATTIKFALPSDSKVVISIYNSLGQKVSDLINDQLSAGYHEVDFNGADLSSGVYYYRMTAEDFVTVKKMMMLK